MQPCADTDCRSIQCVCVCCRVAGGALSEPYLTFFVCAGRTSVGFDVCLSFVPVLIKSMKSMCFHSFLLKYLYF